jgi:hypothetical protein
LKTAGFDALPFQIEKYPQQSKPYVSQLSKNAGAVTNSSTMKVVGNLTERKLI